MVYEGLGMDHKLKHKGIQVKFGKIQDQYENILNTKMDFFHLLFYISHVNLRNRGSIGIRSGLICQHNEEMCFQLECL